MIKRVLLLLSILFLCQVEANAQDARTCVEDGFAKGDAKMVSQVMNDKIFMVSYPIRKSLSKSDATEVLANFFKQNVPTSFSVLHDNSQGDVIYMICKFTSKSAAYRVHVLIDVKTDGDRITQIRIETI